MQSLFVTFIALVFGVGALHPLPQPARPIVENVDAAVVDNDLEAQLSDEGDRLVHDSLISPLNQLNKLDKDMFSRCASGYNYFMQTAPSAANEYYFIGQVRLSVGCNEPKDIVRMRVNKDQTVLEVLDVSTKKYVSTNSWIEQYKTGNATL